SSVGSPAIPCWKALIGFPDVGVPVQTNENSFARAMVIGPSRPWSEPASRTVPHLKHVLSMFHPLLTRRTTPPGSRPAGRGTEARRAVIRGAVLVPRIVSEWSSNPPLPPQHKADDRLGAPRGQNLQPVSRGVPGHHC